jgi:hypothetical protein
MFIAIESEDVWWRGVRAKDVVEIEPLAPMLGGHELPSDLKSIGHKP